MPPAWSRGDRGEDSGDGKLYQDFRIIICLGLGKGDSAATKGVESRTKDDVNTLSRINKKKGGIISNLLHIKRRGVAFGRPKE